MCGCFFQVKFKSILISGVLIQNLLCVHLKTRTLVWIKKLATIVNITDIVLITKWFYRKKKKL